jgi:hypothetical protein
MVYLCAQSAGRTPDFVITIQVHKKGDILLFSPEDASELDGYLSPVSIFAPVELPESAEPFALSRVKLDRNRWLL